MGFQSLSKVVFSGVAQEHHILDSRILAQSFPTIIFQKTRFSTKKFRIENPFVKASKNSKIIFMRERKLKMSHEIFSYRPFLLIILAFHNDALNCIGNIGIFYFHNL